MRAAFLLAIPLIVCKTGQHVPEGGGKPVRQKFERAQREKRPPAAVAEAPPAEEPPVQEAPPPRPKKVAPPPKIAKKPPPKKAEPPPKKIVRRPPPPPSRPSPHLCGNISPELTDPRPMSDEERKPLTETVDAHISDIRACYEEARVRADVDGCMFAVFTVDSAGQLRQPYIDTTNIPDTTMQNCVADAIGGMDLRASVDDVVWVVLYPFFFERGEIFHSSQHMRATG